MQRTLMAASLKASEAGLVRIDQARRQKGWTKNEKAWYELASSSKSTLKRFLQRKPVNQDTFTKFCEAVDIHNWQEIVDNSPNGDELQPTPAVIPIEADPEVAKTALDTPLPRNWNQRALYLGIDGARGWLSVVRKQDYLDASDKEKMRQQLLAVIKGLKIQTFVSMGPGDAETDHEIVINLSGLNGQIIYLPVDISEGLIQVAFRKIRDHAFVPVGILGDFEERFRFISERLESRIESPALVGLLGNTLGNLDRFESTFLRQIENWLNPGDFVLLDVSIASINWTLESDIRSKPSDHFDEMRRFYVAGVSRQTGNPIGELLNNYQERVEYRRGISDVPNTQSIDLFDKLTQVKIVSLRRYHWESFINWLQENFNFHIQLEQSCFFSDSQLGSGMVLLKIKESNS